MSSFVSLFHTCSRTNLARRAGRVQPPQQNSLPVTSVLGTLAVSGRWQRAGWGSWSSRSQSEPAWKQVPLLSARFSPLFLQVERQSGWIYLHLIALEREVGGGELSHRAKLLQWPLSAECFRFGVNFQMENISCATTKQRYCRVTERCS